jgi:hypothetical protein
MLAARWRRPPRDIFNFAFVESVAMIRKMTATDTDHWQLMTLIMKAHQWSWWPFEMQYGMHGNDDWTWYTPFFLFACLTEYGGKFIQQSTKKLQIRFCLSPDHLSGKRISVWLLILTQLRLTVFLLPLPMFIHCICICWWSECSSFAMVDLVVGGPSQVWMEASDELPVHGSGHTLLEI